MVSSLIIVIDEQKNTKLLKKLPRIRAMGDFKVFFSVQSGVEETWGQVLIKQSTHSVKYSFNDVLIQ